MTELQVGVHGLRTFRVSDDGNLLPVTAVDDSWRGGTCIARCRRNPAHRAPEDHCRCGIYTFRSLAVLRAQYEPADSLVAVIALEGQTLAGTKGWRSQAGRVVALWVQPGALPDSLLRALSRNLPDVPLYEDVGQLLADHPQLSASGTDAPVAATTGRPFPARPRPVRGHLIVLFFLAVVILTAVFAVGLGHRAMVVGSESTVGATLTLAGRCGDFLAANDLLFLAPLLFLGVALAARQPTGPVAAVVAGAAWTLAAAISASVLAALVTGRNVQFNLFAAWMMFVFGWRWLGLLLFSVGNADGFVGYAARSVLRAQGAMRRTLSPRRARTGVDYRPRPDHQASCYPLTVPVHFQKHVSDGG